MNTKAIGLSQTTLESLVDSFQHRILALEIEIRQMVREGEISSHHYKKRILLLKKFRLSLQNLEQRLTKKEIQLQGISSRTAIPTTRSRSPEESDVCVRYFEEALYVVEELTKDGQSVLKILKKTIRGRRLHIFSLFDLSRLRRKFLNLGQKTRNFEQAKIGWRRFCASVIDSVSSDIPVDIKATSRVETLKKVYFETEKLHREIVALSLECERMDEELNLKENWLSFQDWKISQYQYNHSSVTPLQEHQRRTRS